MSQFIGFDSPPSGNFIVEPRAVLPALGWMEDVLAFPQWDALYDIRGVRIDVTKRTYVPADVEGSLSAMARVALNDAKYCPTTVNIPSDYDIFPGDIVYGGVVWPHFGHFLCDSLSRFWALDHISDTAPVLYLDRPSPNFRSVPYISPALDALNLHQNRLLTIRKPCLFKRILVPIPSMQHSFRIFHAQAFPHLKIASHFSVDRNSRFRKKKYYLSRQELSTGLRRSKDEDNLILQVAKMGFHSISPEKLSLKEQIELFCNADVIAGTIGSAFHNSLFNNNENLKMVIMTWEKINQRYLMIDAIKPSESFYLNTCYIEKTREDQRVESIRIDVGQTVEKIAAMMM